MPALIDQSYFKNVLNLKITDGKKINPGSLYQSFGSEVIL